MRCKTSLIALVVLMFSPGLAAAHKPKPKPASWITNIVQPKAFSATPNATITPGGCSNTTLDQGNVTEVISGTLVPIAGNTNPWNGYVQGYLVVSNGQALAVDITVFGYIGTGDPAIDPPVNVGKFTLSGNGQQATVPFSLMQSNIPATATRSFSVTVEVEANPVDGPVTGLQAVCTSAQLIPTEHD